MDKFYELLTQMVDGIQKIAPEIWAIYIKQNYVYMTWDIIACIASLLVFWACMHFWKSMHWDSDGAFFLLPIVFSVFVFFICLGMTFARAINPEYYAMKDILQTLNTVLN